MTATEIVIVIAGTVVGWSLFYLGVMALMIWASNLWVGLLFDLYVQILGFSAGCIRCFTEVRIRANAVVFALATILVVTPRRRNSRSLEIKKPERLLRARV
jgi:hypothetical protein